MYPFFVCFRGKFMRGNLFGVGFSFFFFFCSKASIFLFYKWFQKIIQVKCICRLCYCTSQSHRDEFRRAYTIVYYKLGVGLRFKFLEHVPYLIARILHHICLNSASSYTSWFNWLRCLNHLQIQEEITVFKTR